MIRPFKRQLSYALLGQFVLKTVIVYIAWPNCVYSHYHYRLTFIAPSYNIELKEFINLYNNKETTGHGIISI